MRYRTPERQAYLAAGLRVFVATTANMTAQDTAEVFIHARSRIERVVEAQSGPFIYSVRKNSAIHRLD